MDPIKMGLIPLTEEIYLQQKKVRKESKKDKTISDGLKDKTSLSSAANDEIEQGKAEQFMEVASGEISKMDQTSEKFLQEAIGKLVSSALEQEFGETLTSNKGFPAMKEQITRQLLGDPEKLVAIENMLLLMKERDSESI